MVILQFFQAGFEVVLSSAPAIKLHISSTTSCRTTHAILGGGFNPSKSICQIDKSFIISSISACRRVNRNNHDKKAPPRMPAAISEKNTSNNSPFQRKAVRKKKQQISNRASRARRISCSKHPKSLPLGFHRQTPVRDSERSQWPTKKKMN